MSGHDGFKARTGCFNCKVCGRSTRVTSGHSFAGSGMCAQCDEVAGIENAIEDDGDPEGSKQAEIDLLNQAAVNKGGVIDGYTRTGGAA